MKSQQNEQVSDGPLGLDTDAIMRLEVTTAAEVARLGSVYAALQTTPDPIALFLVAATPPMHSPDACGSTSVSRAASIARDRLCTDFALDTLTATQRACIANLLRDGQEQATVLQRAAAAARNTSSPADIAFLRGTWKYVLDLLSHVAHAQTSSGADANVLDADDTEGVLLNRVFVAESLAWACDEREASTAADLERCSLRRAMDSGWAARLPAHLLRRARFFESLGHLRLARTDMVALARLLSKLSCALLMGASNRSAAPLAFTEGLLIKRPLEQPQQQGAPTSRPA